MTWDHADDVDRMPSKSGLPPGTLVPPRDAEPSTLEVIAYGPDACTRQPVENVAALEPLLGEQPVTWINVNGLGTPEVLEALGKLLSLHRLALEDVMHVRQRPKAEVYDGALFIVTRMLEPDLPVRTEQLSLFVGANFVVTFQEHPGDCLDAVRKRILEGLGRVRQMDAAYLAYSLLDAVVDAYFPVIDTFSDRAEELEDRVLDAPDHACVAEIHAFKRDLIAMRRAVGPMREALGVLQHDALHIVGEGTGFYLRDCHDHVVQLIDLVENYRELVGGLLDVYLTSVSNRMNEIMKVLTIIATIFIPLSFFAGLYGMNFDPDVSPYNMPELRSYWGYPVFLGAMLLLAVVETAFFIRKGWIGPLITFRRRRRKKK